MCCILGLCFAHPAMAQTQATPSTANAAQLRTGEPQARLDARIISMPRPQKKLEITLNRSQLVQTRSRVTRMAIADPRVIDVAPFEEREFAIIGTGLGTTTLTLWFEGDENPLIYEITVIRDQDIEEQIRIDYGKLERKVAILFPNSKVYLIPLHDKLVVKGQAKDAAEAARILQIVRGEFLDSYGGLYGPNSGLGRGNGGDGVGDGNGFRNENDLYTGFIVNMLQVPGEYQVMLHVTIAELNRSQLRRMGVNLTLLINDGAAIIGTSLAGGAPTLSGVFSNGDVSVLINALASNGTAKILSRPSLTTLSGHPANFLAGGEFAVPTTVGVGGVQGTSTQFRGFGTSMVVIPTVVDSDLIHLKIAPEFSQINQNNSVGGIPGLDSRRVETTVRLREGQTIVLGGLLSRQMATEVSRLPWLGEVPLVGPLLFNTKRSTEDELELIVLVTPEIVRPMDPEEVPPVPGYYVSHPNDRELYRYAMTEGPPDLEVYQLAPFGNKVGYPNPVGFNVYNPSPATPQYGPIPQANQPNGFPTPSPWTEQNNARYQGNGNGTSLNGDMQNMPPQTMSPQGMPAQMMDPQSMNSTMGQPQNYDPQMQIPQQFRQQAPAMAPPAQQQWYQPEPQLAPPAYQGYPPGMSPTPDPGVQSYRGGMPTAGGQPMYQQPGGQLPAQGGQSLRQNVPFRTVNYSEALRK